MTKLGDSQIGVVPPSAGSPEPVFPSWSVEASLADRQAFLNQLSEGVIITDAEGQIVFVNAAAQLLHGQAVLGVGPDAYTASYHLLTMDGEPFPVEDLPLTRAVRGGEVTVDSRWRIRRADGSEILAIGNARPMYDKHGKQIAAILNIRDDTQRHADEIALKELVRAKDMLLHEVNHRVKNSLQLVTSLLSLQAARSDHVEVRQGLTDASKRVSVIARIHERLYAESEHDSVNIGALLRDLAQDNVHAHSSQGQIRLETDCHDFNVALDWAVPMALCTTELVTNAMKYAFDGCPAGTIRLVVRLTPDDIVEIRVSDDGKGLPAGFDPALPTGLGMRIVTALVRQLRADLDFASTPQGATFAISFRRGDNR